MAARRAVGVDGQPGLRRLRLRGTLDTVKHFTSLPINYLITVNFHGFKEIVDKIGGIWLDVDRRYYHVNNGTAAENYANINLQPGYQLLTGEQALDFVRYRHTDDDYHRIARQQQFVRALKQQFAHKFSPLELPSLVPTITNNVEVGGKLERPGRARLAALRGSSSRAATSSRTGSRA